MVRSLYGAGAGILSLAILWLAGCESAPRFKPALDDNPIKAGDVLLVTCSSNAEPFAVQWTVDKAGNVRLPYSGPWRVAGKKPSELGKELSQYFSVRRTVTFKIEKIGADFYKGSPPPSAATGSTPTPSREQSSTAGVNGKRLESE